MKNWTALLAHFVRNNGDWEVFILRSLTPFGNAMEASIPLIIFMAAGLFSPGPNVVMLTASGARFGFRASLPHLLGVPIGTGLLGATSALGLNAVLLTWPGLKLGFQVAAALWILWLSWKMAQAGRAGKTQDQGRPFTFLEAIVFQAVNPKVWALTMAGAAAFGIGLAPHLEAGRMFLVVAVVNFAVCLFWTTIGHMLSRYLQSDKVWRIFMTVMAIVMAGTIFLIFA